MTSLPLEGVRVLDFTMVTAGPNATLYMGDMGAEIIKVESAGYFDSFRRQGMQLFKGERPYDHSAPFLILNRNKYGVTINLAHPLGKDLVKRLVQVCDVLTENFRASVMPRQGLGYSVLKEVIPSLIMISIGSQGSVGPEANYGSYGLVLDALSGIASLTGYVEGTPTWTAGVNYPDQNASIFAAGLVLAALRHRRKTGLGGYIDLSQREFTTNMVGEAVLDYTFNGRVGVPMGNRHPTMAPHGCFPCKGEDRWVTIAVASDDEWQALCQAMDRSDLAQDPKFANAEGRRNNQDELEDIIAQWTSTQDSEEVTVLLQSRGIAAGPVYSGKDLLENPHLKAREFVQYAEVPDMDPFPHKSVVPKMSRAEVSIRRHAPGLGEHNEYIYRDLLGLSEAELEELRQEHVIDDVPGGGLQAWAPP